MDKQKILSHYKENKDVIDSRLDDFEKLRDADNKRLFKELVFVILTSQSSAKKSWKATEKLDELDLLESSEKEEIARILELHDIQYERNKASYIVENRKKLSQPTLTDPSGNLKLKDRIKPDNLDQTRKWFVENINGLSWKGGSHFLRNIGYGNSFAIISSRIVSKLYELDYIEKLDQPSDQESYLEIERKMQDLAKETGIDVKALDLVLWSMETGEVFK